MQFRFVDDQDWMNYQDDDVDAPKNDEAMTAFCNYSEPFNCECRAFGRLQEAGWEALAVKCYGYILLDEEHERALTEQCGRLGVAKIRFDGSLSYSGPNRSRFPGKDGRAPPIRGIVKEFGVTNAPLRVKHVRKLLRDVIRFQQLGVIRIDPAHRQLVNGKLCDLSTALTVPHFLLNPELIPHLTPNWIPAIEFEAFQFTMADYWDIGEMVVEWNSDVDEGEVVGKKISFFVFSDQGQAYTEGYRAKYSLRNTRARTCTYALVDPRRYNWKSSAAGPGTPATKAPEGKTSGQTTNGSIYGTREEVISKPRRRRLQAKPPRWYLDTNSKKAKDLKDSISFCTSIGWEYKDGYIFPRPTWRALCH